MNDFEFRTPPAIVLKKGASREVAGLILSRFSVRHVMLVTDRGLVAAGIVEPVVDALEQQGLEVTVYDNVVADPPEATVRAAIEHARASGIDCVLGLGGGSPMDVAKVIAVMLTSNQSLEDIYGIDMVDAGRTTPLVLMPTTAGTGSEVTPISIITTGETTKKGIVAPQLFADIAILDPELTVGLPRHITAATGIDAMVHAFEAYTTKHKKNPMSDALARSALQKLYTNLLRVCENGEDIDARAEMLLGSMMAGQAFANAPVAAVHALAYPIGGIFHVSHGLSNALVMPHVLRFNLPKAKDLYAELADVVDPGVTGSSAAKAEIFIDSLENLAVATRVPRTLIEVGIGAADLDRLADDAMLQTRLLVNNPRDMSLEDVRAIYEAAL